MHEEMKDLQEILYTPEQLAEMVQRLGAAISRDYAGKDLLVLGVLKGAFVFAADLVRAITVPAELDFIQASSYGNETISSGKVNIKKDIECDIRGRNVLIVEDIVDSGITMYALRKIFTAREPASLKVCAALSKPSRREVPMDVDYLGWEVPDEFLVGYGLDYSQKYRTLPCIGVLKREIYA